MSVAFVKSICWRCSLPFRASTTKFTRSVTNALMDDCIAHAERSAEGNPRTTDILNTFDASEPEDAVTGNTEEIMAEIPEESGTIQSDLYEDAPQVIMATTKKLPHNAPSSV